MRRSFSVAAWAVVLSLPFSGCSLMGLDEFDARPCESDFDCAEAQQQHGLDPTLCGKCVEGLCDFQHRHELCNGEDDDCDGLIDEGLSVEPREYSGLRAPADPVAFATTELGPTTTYLAIGGATHEGFVIAEDGRGEPQAELRFDSASRAAERPCPALTLQGNPGAIGCVFTDLALAVDSQHLVYAAVNAQTCGKGQLRIGLGDRLLSPFTVWLGGPVGASPSVTGNIDFGVDIEGNGYCGGASLAVGDSPAPGARSPVIASIGTTEGAPGALATWLAANAAEPDTGSCGSTRSISVQALGVYLPSGAPAGLLGTDRGKPLELGHTTSLAPPAVVALAWPEGMANYLVAFASEEQGERGVRLVRVDVQNHRLKSEAVRFIPDAFADRVVLALGDVDSTGPKVGVSWTTPCGATPSLRFVTVAPLLAQDGAAPQTLETARPAQRAQLLYRPEGFATVPPTGGWFLLWEEPMRANLGEVKLARLVEGAREPLNVVTLTSGALGYPLLLPSSPSSAGYALLQAGQAGAQFESLVGWCDVRG